MPINPYRQAAQKIAKRQARQQPAATDPSMNTNAMGVGGAPATMGFGMDGGASDWMQGNMPGQGIGALNEGIGDTFGNMPGMGEGMAGSELGFGNLGEAGIGGLGDYQVGLGTGDFTEGLGPQWDEGSGPTPSGPTGGSGSGEPGDTGPGNPPSEDDSENTEGQYNPEDDYFTDDTDIVPGVGGMTGTEIGGVMNDETGSSFDPSNPGGSGPDEGLGGMDLGEAGFDRGSLGSALAGMAGLGNAGSGRLGQADYGFGDVGRGIGGFDTGRLGQGIAGGTLGDVGGSFGDIAQGGMGGDFFGDVSGMGEYFDPTHRPGGLDVGPGTVGDPGLGFGAGLGKLGAGWQNELADTVGAARGMQGDPNFNFGSHDPGEYTGSNAHGENGGNGPGPGEDPGFTRDTSGDENQDWITKYLENAFGEGNWDAIKSGLEEQRDQSLAALAEQMASRGLTNSGVSSGLGANIYRSSEQDIASAQEDWRQRKVDQMRDAASMLFKDRWEKMDDAQQKAMAELMYELDMAKQLGQDWKDNPSEGLMEAMARLKAAFGSESDSIWEQLVDFTGLDHLF